MPRWIRLSSSIVQAYMYALGLASVACSLGDFDSLGAGPDQNVGGSAGAGGNAGDGGTGGSSGGGSSGDAGSAGVGGSSGEPTNLIPNGGFEGSSSWACIGNCRTEMVMDNPRSGTRCLLTTERTQAWEGPSLNLLGRVDPAESYRITVWVRTQPSGDAGVDSYTLGLTQKVTCASAAQPVYTPGTTTTATPEWGELTGVIVAPDCSDLQESSVYLEGAPVGAEFCIDDTSLELMP